MNRSEKQEGKRQMDMEILDLTVDNAFDFCAVLDAVGVNKVIGAFDKKEINALRKGGKSMKNIGMVLAMKVFGVIIGNIPNAREPLYTFLAGCVRWSNGHPVTKDELRTMKIGKFVKLIKEFAKKEDIVDFFTDVVGSLDTAPTDSENSSTGDTPAPGITLTEHSGEDS